MQGCALSLALVLSAEALLRLGGRPTGRYAADLSAGVGFSGGPWEPSYRALIESGPIAYRLSTNAHGFRGPELRTGEDAAALRLVAIGDSMTEGFYVDDAATYPAQLEASLRAAGRDVEVINAARGGGSMDRFVQLLERCVVPLEPDLVLVTFVSNDLADLGWFPLEEARPAPLERLATGFVSHTAIGELMLERLLGQVPLPQALEASALLDGRYSIEGGEAYQVNASLFMQRYGDRDGLALASELSPIGRQAFEIYQEQLERFVATCRGMRADVLLIYMPAYPELYLERPQSAARRLLTQEAEALGIGFLDLTEGLRRASLEEGLGALHLAPVDFHLNPQGNRIVAREVAAALEELGLLEPKARQQ